MQSTVPQGVKSGACISPHPVPGSQVATLQAAVGLGQVRGRFTQPMPSAQPSMVHSLLSLQLRATPWHSPPRHCPRSRQVEVGVQSLPSGSTDSEHELVSSTNREVRHGTDGTQSSGCTPVPLSVTDTTAFSLVMVSSRSSCRLPAVNTTSTGPLAPPLRSTVSCTENGASVASASEMLATVVAET
ncbi:MAG: hypothetical protein IPJ65_26145 [Archangiaceae bacterium]|nr:hypothetical protein [Archangiaceae bacterium]